MLRLITNVVKKAIVPGVTFALGLYLGHGAGVADAMDSMF